MEGAGGKVAEPSLIWDGICSRVVRARQVSLFIGSDNGTWRIAVLGRRSGSEEEVVQFIEMHEKDVAGDNVLDIPVSQKSRLIKSDGDQIFWEDDSGQLARRE